ncbi:MAG: NHL repeat-containing protein [Planctomycetota bacterium]
MFAAKASRSGLWWSRALALLLLAAGPGAEAAGTFGLGGTESDFAGAVAVDGAGNLYVAGGFGGTVDFDPGPKEELRTAVSASWRDAFVAKYDAAGGLQWVVAFGSPGADLARSVVVDGQGEVCVAGHFGGTVDFDPADAPDAEDTLATKSGRNAFLARYGADGTFRWVRGFGDEDHAPKESKLADVEWSEDVWHLALDARGNIYLTGFFRGVIDLDPGAPTVERKSVADSTDAFVVTLDPAGAYRWGFTFGGEDADQGHAIALGPQDTVVLAGRFGATVDFDPGKGTAAARSRGRFDAYLAWYGPDGRFQNVVTWGGYGIDQVNQGALAVDAQGVVYAAGEFKGKADFAPGKRKLVRNSDGVDAYLVRHRPGGGLDWVVTVGGGGSDAAHALCLDRDGNVFVTGRFQKRVDFAPGRRQRFLGAKGTAGASHAFVATYDPRGKLRWARSLGADESGLVKLTRGAGVAVRPDGHVVALGTFFGTLDVDPGRKKLLLPSRGAADLFVVRYDAAGGVVP